MPNDLRTGRRISASLPIFDRDYFGRLLTEAGLKLSPQAPLATGQRIPGLGNGVIQDILFHAGIHPRRKIATLSGELRGKLFETLKSTLAEMTAGGGRNTREISSAQGAAIG